MFYKEGLILNELSCIYLDDCYLMWRSYKPLPLLESSHVTNPLSAAMRIADYQYNICVDNDK
jgi:hypothetical protein